MRERASSIWKALAFAAVLVSLHGSALANERGDALREAKLKLRERFLRQTPTAAPGLDDRAEDLVDSLTVRSLNEMERRRLASSQLDEQPWSDDYWATYRGGLAYRYADQGFPQSTDWKENRDYVVRTIGTSSLETLSPAEKYDLLVGDPANTMTRAMVEEGRRYYSATGKVETWMGLCHGWAPASYMLPRPERPIEVMAADGRTWIKFYPADIKALATALWAKSAPPTRFIGGRCNAENPEEGEAGRPVDQGCFDSNPGTWHLAIVNQIGVSRRSFVMDATYDYQVWNQPISGYSYRYFNPRNGEYSATLGGASVRASEFQDDKYRNFRAENAVNIVGVEMRVIYIAETTPTHDELDTAEDDAVRTARYRYDLELDARGEIVGGEWHSNYHPDFLWTPVPGGRAWTTEDRYLDRVEPIGGAGWDGKNPIPTGWKPFAVSASKKGLPLARIVESLTAISGAGL